MLLRKNIKRPCITVGCGGYVRGSVITHPKTGRVEQHPRNRDQCFKCLPRKQGAHGHTKNKT
jgi:hypothetical protein